MCENQQWLPLVTLVGLLTCPVPVRLKAEILHILAAFAKTPHIASAIWQSIETAQVFIALNSRCRLYIMSVDPFVYNFIHLLAVIKICHLPVVFLPCCATLTSTWRNLMLI